MDSWFLLSSEQSLSTLIIYHHWSPDWSWWRTLKSGHILVIKLSQKTYSHLKDLLSTDMKDLWQLPDVMNLLFGQSYLLQSAWAEVSWQLSRRSENPNIFTTPTTSDLHNLLMEERSISNWESLTLTASLPRTEFLSKVSQFVQRSKKLKTWKISILEVFGTSKIHSVLTTLNDLKNKLGIYKI